MPVQPASQFFLTHGATSNISINPEPILFPTLTSSVTISDERKEIKQKTDPHHLFSGKDPGMGSKLMTARAIVFSVRAVVIFGTWHSSAARKHFQAFSSMPVTVNPGTALACRATTARVKYKICAHRRWIFHHTFGLTLV